MHWLYQNINHFTVPLGMLLSLFAAFVGIDRLRRQKNGLPLASFKGSTAALTYVAICLCCILLGIALVRNFV
jgi:hypothetical protein